MVFGLVFQVSLTIGTCFFCTWPLAIFRRGRQRPKKYWAYILDYVHDWELVIIVGIPREQMNLDLFRFRLVGAWTDMEAQQRENGHGGGFHGKGHGVA